MIKEVRQLASQKGWIRIDYDQAIWIPCLPVFPAGHDLRSWAILYAEHWWEASGADYGEHQIKALQQSLEHLHKIAYSELPCHMALIHLPDPRELPLLVCFGVWQAVGDRNEQLRLLSHADEQDAIQPPIVAECDTGKLGGGLRCMCYVKQQHGTMVSGCLNYAWRSEEFETAVRMFTSCPNLGRLQQAIPDLEALTQVISFISR
jgi:hypothetical protein